jgi:hypothetical protein
MTDHVHVRLGNAEPVHGKPAFVCWVAECRSYIDASPVYS